MTLSLSEPNDSAATTSALARIALKGLNFFIQVGYAECLRRKLKEHFLKWKA